MAKPSGSPPKKDSDSWGNPVPETLTSPVYDALKRGQFSLENCYSVPRQSIMKSDRHGEYHLHFAVELFSKFGNTPVVVYNSNGSEEYPRLDEALTLGFRSHTWRSTGPRRISLISGVEQFDRMTHADDYYVKDVDIGIIQQHQVALASIMNDANVVELGVGDGEKSELLIKAMHKQKTKPRRFIVNDIVSGSVNKTRRRLEKAGLLPGQIQAARGDFFTEQFWNKPIWKQLREAEERTVIVLQGATWNNFNARKQDWLLRKSNAVLKPRSDLLFSIDSTPDPVKLKKAYDTPDSKEFLLKGFVYALETIGVRLDVKKLSCEISIDNTHPDYVAIKLGPIKCPPFTAPPPEGNPKGQIYNPEKNPIYFEEIHKIREDKIGATFHDVGQSLVNIMHFSPIHSTSHRDVQQAWWHVKTPGPLDFGIK